jgi:hypothetical protein
MMETNHKEAVFASAWLVETFEDLGAGARQEKRKHLGRSEKTGGFY